MLYRAGQSSLVKVGGVTGAGVVSEPAEDVEDCEQLNGGQESRRDEEATCWAGIGYAAWAGTTLRVGLGEGDGCRATVGIVGWSRAGCLLGRLEGARKWNESCACSLWSCEAASRVMGDTLDLRPRGGIASSGCREVVVCTAG